MASTDFITSSHPWLAAEFDRDLNFPLTANKLSSRSNKKVWWRCLQGHSYQATVSHRVEGTNCPVCSNKKIVEGVNDLATLNPKLATQLNLSRSHIGPTEVGPGSSKKVWWICEHGHEWEAQVAKRNKGQGCPVCANRVVVEGFNDLSSRFPLAASSWHPTKNSPVTPNQVPYGTAKSYWWQCKLGHEWKATFDKRRVAEGCAICNGVRVEQGTNDLLTKFPKTIELWDYSKNGHVQPSQISASGSTKYWWRCPKGHSFIAVASSVAHSKQTGCPVCAGKKVVVGFNDLATTDGYLVPEWDFDLNEGVSPNSVTRGSDRLVSWKCSQSHRWIATISSRASQNVGCPVCSGNKVLSGFNDLATKNPEIISEWDFMLNGNLDPREVMPGSHASVWWVCKHQHRWQASIANRSRGRNCPVCRFAEPGVNDLESTYPDLLAEWDYTRNLGISPSAVSMASGIKVAWQCSKGHKWKASVANRTVVGTGCPSCAVTGYKVAEPGILYFLINESLQARKIGITNAGKSRLAKFEQRGWRQINVLENPDGQIIYDLEQIVLKWLRTDCLLPAILTKKEMGAMGGWTETFSLDGVSDSQVLSKIYSTLELLEDQNESGTIASN